MVLSVFSIRSEKAFFISGSHCSPDVPASAARMTEVLHDRRAITSWRAEIPQCIHSVR